MAAQHDTIQDLQPGLWQELPLPDTRTIRLATADGRVLTDFTPKIFEHMTVLSRDNEVAGEVVEIEPDTKAIELGRDALGQHHWIPMDWVKDVDVDGVHLSCTLEAMRAEWTDARPGLPPA